MRALTELDREAIAALRARDEFFWLDLTTPGAEEIDLLGELFGLHPLALEDTREFGQRPKLDDYEDQALLVVYGVQPHPPEPPRLVEVHLHLSGSFVVTIHREEFGPLRSLPRRLERHHHAAESWVVYAVVDALTDTFFPVLEALGEEIDEVEVELLEDARREHAQRIARLRRDLIVLRRVAVPQRDLLTRAGTEIAGLPGLQVGARDYFRDVHDHAVAIAEQIDAQRDALRGALDVYSSANAQEINESNERLALISTIFLPLTFITGFFGQNFGWLVGHVDSLADFLVLGGGGLLVPLVLFFVYFRRQGYFTRGR